MNTPNGNLEIVREYTCGCIVYRDVDGREFYEKGLFCENSYRGRAWRHENKTLVQGEETQTTLF